MDYSTGAIVPDREDEIRNGSRTVKYKATHWNQRYSVWGWNLTLWDHMNFIWVMQWKIKHFCVLMLDIFILQK